MRIRQITAVLVALAAFVLVPAIAARAETVTWRPIPGDDGHWSAYGPVYDPASKSYFELHKWTGNGFVRWNDAKRHAEEQNFKGVTGQLAVIRDYDTHFFLLKTFRVDAPVWIGARVLCQAMRAFWIDGKPLDEQEFNAWDLESWHRTDVNCMNPGKMYGGNFMGIYYTPYKQLFRWQAAGPLKSFHYVFVEYPTGHP